MPSNFRGIALVSVMLLRNLVSADVALIRDPTELESRALSLGIVSHS